MIVFTKKRHDMSLLSAACNEVEANIGYHSPEGNDFFDEPKERLVGKPSDMWTVGCMLLEVLMGEQAFMERQVRREPYQQQAAHTMQRQKQWVRCCWHIAVGTCLSMVYKPSERPLCSAFGYAVML